VEYNGAPCVVMELCAEGAFSDAIPVMTLPQKLKVLQQSAIGMVYLHDLSPKVIHRDIKAANSE
jgi:serine/threonine protein kinase